MDHGESNSVPRRYYLRPMANACFGDRRHDQATGKDRARWLPDLRFGMFAQSRKERRQRERGQVCDYPRSQARVRALRRPARAEGENLGATVDVR